MNSDNKKYIAAPFLPYKESVPVAPEYLKDYFLVTEPRTHKLNHVEAETIQEVRQAWSDMGGGMLPPGSFGECGGMQSLLWPECRPDCIRRLTPLNELSFMLDGKFSNIFLYLNLFFILNYVDCDVKAITQSLSPEQVAAERKRYYTIINQLMGKWYIESMSEDEASVRYIASLEEWREHEETMGGQLLSDCCSVEDRLNQGLSFMGVEYVPMLFSLQNCTNPFGRAAVDILRYCCDVHLTDKEAQMLQPVFAIFGRVGTMINDLYSFEKEWQCHAQADERDFPGSTVYLTMHFNDFSISEVKEVIKKSILKEEQALLNHIRLCEKEETSLEVKKCLFHLQLMTSGTLVFHLVATRYTIERYPKFRTHPTMKLKDLPRREDSKYLHVLPAANLPSPDRQSHLVKHDSSVRNGSKLLEASNTQIY